MEIKVSKCATAPYIDDENRIRTYLDDSLQFRRKAIANLTTAKSMRRPGASIAAGRTVELRSAKFKLKEMEILLAKIMSSPRLTVEKTDAVKIFLLSSIYFLLLNGKVGGTQLRVIDQKIRGMIIKEVKIKGLPIECHHPSWKDGGMSYPSLRDRGDVLPIRSFAQMMLSHDECVRAAMRQFIEDEREFRRIETNPTAQFFDWKEGTGTRAGTSTIVEKTRRARKN
jgi:hypothetical protein